MINPDEMSCREAAEHIDDLLERYKETYSFMIPVQAVALEKAKRMLLEKAGEEK